MIQIPIGATIGEKIRAYRQAAGMTQKELADLCGISDAAIRNYELGNRIPDYETTLAIADSLRINQHAISFPQLDAVYGAAMALFEINRIYGLAPTVIDGHVHFVFESSMTEAEYLRNCAENLNLTSPGPILEHVCRTYAQAYEMYKAGAMNEEEFLIWQSKIPAYMNDVAVWANRKKRETPLQLPEDASTKPAGKRRRKPKKQDK